MQIKSIDCCSFVSVPDNHCKSLGGGGGHQKNVFIWPLAYAGIHSYFLQATAKYARKGSNKLSLTVSFQTHMTVVCVWWFVTFIPWFDTQILKKNHILPVSWLDENKKVLIINEEHLGCMVICTFLVVCWFQGTFTSLHVDWTWESMINNINFRESYCQMSVPSTVS